MKHTLPALSRTARQCVSRRCCLAPSKFPRNWKKSILLLTNGQWNAFFALFCMTCLVFEWQQRVEWTEFLLLLKFFSKNVSYYFHIHQNQSCCCLFKYFPFLFGHESFQAIFPSFGFMTWKSYSKIRCRASDIRLSLSVLLGNIFSNLISSCWKVYCSINTKFLSN